MLTPEEMRAKSAIAREEDRHKAAAKRRQKAQEHEARLMEIMKRKDTYILSVENAMNQAGSSTKVSALVNVRPHWGDREDYKPLLQAVVDHFAVLGFKAEYYFDNQTEYHGDGAGPGEDHQIIVVDWSES